MQQGSGIEQRAQLLLLLSAVICHVQDEAEADI